MGFLDKKLSSEQPVEEIWKVLGGHYYEHVTLNNLRILLLAIQNVLIEHGKNVDRDSVAFLPFPSQENLSNSNQDLALTEGSVGKFNSHGDFFMDVRDMRIITKKFNTLSVNRRQHEIRSKKLRKEAVIKQQI